MSMHHIYTGSKGDPLCPLGFHPQVRWPTRCKRCFRDYKEHGGKGGKDADTPTIRKDDTTMSTPSLSTWSSSRAKEEIKTSSYDPPTPSSSPSTAEEPKTTSRFTGRPSSWTSTPDLSEADAPTVSITLPRRRITADLTSSLDAATRSTEFTVRRRTSTSSGDLTKLDDLTANTTIKTRNTSPFVSKTIPKEESPAKVPIKTKVSISTNTTENLVKKPVENKNVPLVTQNSSKPPGKTKTEEPPKHSDVEFIFKVKSSNEESAKKQQVVRQTSSVLIPPHGSSSSSSSDTEQSSADDDDDDKTSTAGTETTETTIVNANESLLQDEIESLKSELETLKTRCDKAEREKSDLLLRRLASYDTTPTKHTASEVLKLQQKVNEMTAQLEDLRDEKKSLSLKVRELEADWEQKNRTDEKARRAEELQGKLTAAETLCEELMDENEDIKKELHELEDEIEEMRDNFREDQAEEYSGLRKELQQTTKNCRILSFKLRKSERRTEELEAEKLELERRFKEAAGGQKGVDNLERLKKVEADLNVANEVASRLTKELEEAKAKLKSKDIKDDATKKKPPLLGSIPKTTSGEKMSRASLTRGGSQEDPQQLLRDLQDSMEREADLREQLKFAEEELHTYILRKQLKKLRKSKSSDNIREGWHSSSSPISSSSMDDISLSASCAPVTREERIKVFRAKVLPYVPDYVRDVFERLLQKTDSRDTQTEHISNRDNDCQHDLIEFKDEFIQTETNSNKHEISQTDEITLHEQFAQTEINTEDKELQAETLLESKETWIEEELMEPIIRCSESSAQTEAIRTAENDAQTAGIDRTEAEAQTDSQAANMIVTDIPVSSVLPEESRINVTLIEMATQTEVDPSIELIPAERRLENLTKSLEEHVNLLEECTAYSAELNNKEFSNEEDLLSVAEEIVPVIKRSDSTIFLNTIDEDEPQEEANTTTSGWFPIWPSTNPLRQIQCGISSLIPTRTLFSPMATLMTPLGGRRRSPTPNRLTPEPFVEKDEGISEEEDPAELRLMLELNEQETAVLRKKVEELESDVDAKKRKIKEMDEKLNQKTGKRIFGKDSSTIESSSPLEKEKMKVIEEECGELRKKLIEKERENERLQNEVQRKKGTLIKSKSLDSGNEQQALDFKRQLQLVEQEVTVLRTKTQTLEDENEKLSAENRKLQLLRGTKRLSSSSESLGESEKSSLLDVKLAESEKMIKELKEKLEKAETSAKKSPLGSAFSKSTELEKVKKELKTKTEDAEKWAKEAESTKEALRRLREDAVADILSFYKARAPKRPTDMTTKLQMKKMVDELENEIGDILIALQKSKNYSNKQTADGSAEKEKDNQIKELEEKLRAAEAKKTNTAEKEKVEKSLAEEKEKLKKLETERKLMESEKKKLANEVQKLQKERDTWVVEKKNLENKIEELNNEKKNSVLAQDEVAVFIKKLDNLTKDLEKERETVSKLKEQIASVNKLEEEKSKLQKEVTDRNKQILDFDRKLREGEGKIRTLEKNHATGKSKITKLEKTVEDLEAAKAEREGRCKVLQEELNGQDDLNQILKKRIAELEDVVERRNDNIKNLEDTLRKERERASDASLKAGSAEKREMTSLREELAQKMMELDEASSKCEELERKKKEAEEALKSEQAEMKKQNTEMKKESESMSKKLADLEIDVNAEKKKCEKMKATHEKEQKNREMELATLKIKIKTLEQTQGDSIEKVAEVREELNNKYKKLEVRLAHSRQQYEDLTVKYELLEEEHVVTKAQMVMEKEKIQNQLVASKREGESLSQELSTQRETFSSKQDAWIKEKIDLQEELKETIERLTRNSESKWELEKSLLVSMQQEQQSIADGLKNRNEAMEEQMDHMRKENEEMRKKLADFEKVEKIHKQMAQESDKLASELKEVRNKWSGEDKSHKAELAAQKLRYESRVNLISEELQSSQGQLSRFKRERDAYRHMLEEAQTQMAELKSGKRRESRPNSTSGDEEEAKETIAALEQQLSVMEDELSEARLEGSKLKTELVSEKSAWEVKVSELQSKVNTLEEDKILSSGRTKIPGLRTRMELAWAKEREDQTRLLQETSTLARDLRQTLFEVERERDKERLEAKRRHDTMKRTSEEELEENRKKITELQCDLLELRDAHAKLRTTNEKLRREREKGDREMRAQMRARRTDDEERRLNSVMDQIESFMTQLPEVLEEKAPYLDLPHGFRLRSPSPAINPNEDKAKQLQLTLQRLHTSVVDMRTSREIEDRGRRSVSIGFGRRAGSTEPESESSNNGANRVQRKPSLYRKSLSLSETAGPAANDQAIWKEEQDGSINSLQSLDDHVNNRLMNMGKRESSMDSRLSGGSTQSEMVGKQKKKKGLLGKLKKLTKGKSEDKGSQEDFHAFKSTGGSDSDMSAVGESDPKGSKSDLKGKLSGIFSKKGTTSRGNSVERTLKPEDGSKSLPRSTKSPAKSIAGTEKSSTLGRTLDKSKNPTSGMYRK